MAGKLGSKLAQLATARRQVAVEAELTPEQRAALKAQQEAQKAAAHTAALQNILQPHVDEFNELTEAALHLSLEATPPHLAIKQSRVSLLTVQLTAKAAVFKRRGNAYTSDDYFTIHPQPDGTLTFARYSPEVEKPFDANRFAEFLLMEALGLNEPA